MVTPREPLVPWVMPAVVALAGLCLVWAGQLRLGGYVLAGGFVVAAVLRVVLAPARAGALAIRSRVVDIVFFLGTAAALAVGTHSVNIPPPGG